MNYARDSFISWIAAGNLEGVRGALRAGADPNQKNERGESALRLAIRQRKKDIIEVLVSAGADVSDADLFAAVGQHDDVELVELIARVKKEGPTSPHSQLRGADAPLRG